MPEFRTFGADHVAVLVLIVAASAAIVAGGRRLPPAVGQALAVGLLSYAAVTYIVLWRKGWLTHADSLPLHLCNIVLFITIAALLRPTPLLFELTYFWGMAGALQALITPDLYEGFPSWLFILFFWGHGMLMLAIAYLIAGRGMRPRPGSVLRMMIASNIYVAVVGAIDWMAGWNYGYLCRPPGRASLIDWLGPWPWYILGLEAIALVSFIILNFPWKSGDLLKRL